MATGFKIRLDLERDRAVFIRMNYGARGTLYRSGRVVISRDGAKDPAIVLKALEELAIVSNGP